MVCGVTLLVIPLDGAFDPATDVQPWVRLSAAATSALGWATIALVTNRWKSANVLRAINAYNYDLVRGALPAP